MFLVDDDNKKNHLKADIRVIGVGGGGGNAVETMIKEGIEGVTFVSINTDAQALTSSSSDIKIQLGEQLTKGLGAGANPEIGRRAAMESYEEIVNHLKGADMVFITAGMGGGTGTGGSPVVAEAARDLGILTVGIVTYPFPFEGNRRKKYADAGIAELKKHVDTLIVIPNEKLLEISKEDTPLLQTFHKTDEILLQAVKGIAELVSVQGLINLDFADVRTVMSNQGLALMSIGSAKGKKRAIEAVSQAVSSPLLANLSINGSRGMIVNIRGGSNLSLTEVNQATSCLTEVADPDAEIIVGAVIDESMGDSLSVTLIATGFKNSEEQTMESLSRNLKNQASLHIEESPQEEETKIHEIPQEEETEVGETSQEEKFEVQEDHQEEETKIEEAPQEEIAVKEKDVLDNEKEALTLKDKLLLKAKEYSEKIQEPDVQDSQDQMDMNLKEESEENQDLDYESYSPFESEIDLSNEDLS